MHCSSCGSSQGFIKQGISQKNGKPWKGWQCGACKTMIWLKTETQSAAPAAQGIGPNQILVNQLMMLNKKVQAILDLMTKQTGEPPVIGEEEMESDQETPF